MATDPRNFVVKQCGNAQAAQVGADKRRKDFFNSLDKVGDIELLNRSALGGAVGQGLRSLSATSDLIRTGQSVPGNKVPRNGLDVLLETGISESQAGQVGSFNPKALDSAMGQAKSIAGRVRAGKFSLRDIPNSFASIQNLSDLAKGIFSGGSGNTPDKIEVCQAAPYAMDLIAFAPKYKFLFIVEFIFADEFRSIKGKDTAFVIKSTGRPHVTFEHEEVNMYNFRVKVPKRTIYEPVTMKFYDDNKNGAMHLYEAYLKAISPIANMSFYSQPENAGNIMEMQSMDFDAIGASGVWGGDGYSKIHEYTASMGPVSASPDVKNIIRRINMYHVYDYGRQVNTYRFLNPKILTLELDDLDMAESGNGSEFSFQFAYDAVNIATDVPMWIPDRKEKIKSMTTNGKYPLDVTFKGDLPHTDNPEGNPNDGGGFFSDVGKGLGAVTGAASGVIDAGTGLVSNAFTSVSKFAGSVFSEVSSSASATNASVRNAIKGDVPSNL